MPQEILFPYTATELTEAVVKLPNLYGMLGVLGLFPSEGMASRIVEIAFEEGEVIILAADVPGAAGQVAKRERQNSKFIEIPHFPMEANIGPADLQGLLEIQGSTRTRKTFERELARKLQTIRRSHALTREYIRIGALKGLVRDGKGKILIDLHSHFGVTKKTFYFNLGSSTTSILDKCQEIVQYYAESARGETISVPLVVVDGGFFSKLIQHAKVEKFWLQTQNAQALVNIKNVNTGGSYGRRFEFGGVIFQEYLGSVPINGSSERIIAQDKGHAIPLGTTNCFRTYDGPVHHLNHVNQAPAGEVFISPKTLDHGEGVELRSQSNQIAIAKRPDLLCDVSAEAS